jgi:catechol 2,3-dioxygenase-like lactoylglutathione lyase family enzyme
LIGYATLGTNDLDRAARFYDRLLGELGAKRILTTDRSIFWSAAPNRPALSVVKPHDGKPASVGNGTMVALAVKDPAQVDQLHALALELGGTDEGAPGPRGSSFYGGYFRDLDGNKLNFFCMGAG